MGLENNNKKTSTIPNREDINNLNVKLDHTFHPQASRSGISELASQSS